MSPDVYQLFVIASVAWLAHGAWSDWLLAAKTAKEDGATLAQLVVAFALVAGVFTLARAAVAFAVYRVARFVIGGAP
jgi:hypothetical protein